MHQYLETSQVIFINNFLECFGNCQYDKSTIQVEEKAKEETKEIAELKNKVKMMARKEEPKKLVDQVIKLTSYEEFKTCLDQIKLFDETLAELSLIRSDVLNKFIIEKEAIEKANWEKMIQSRQLRKFQIFKYYSTT